MRTLLLSWKCEVNKNIKNGRMPYGDVYKRQDLSSITHYISAITEPKELSFLKDRLVNLDELNYLAKRMDSFFGDEETQFFEAIKLEHFTEMKDLINLTFNLDKYTLIKDVSDMGKVGREYLLNTEGCIPAHDEDNPKYAQIGRELLRSGHGIFTEHGLLFPDQNRPFEELYNGKTFPAYIYDPVSYTHLADGFSFAVFPPCFLGAVVLSLAPQDFEIPVYQVFFIYPAVDRSPARHL